MLNDDEVNVYVLKYSKSPKVSPHNNAWAKVEVSFYDSKQLIITPCSRTICVDVDRHWLSYTNGICHLYKRKQRCNI